MGRNLTHYVSPLEESLEESLEKPLEEKTLIAMPYPCLIPYHLTTVHEFH